MAETGRVIIIGGGVGGLTAGIALRQAGIDVTVFEASSRLREIGSGLGIQYAAMKALREIGLYDAVREMGQPLLRMEMKTWDGRPLMTIPHVEFSQKLGVQTVNVHRGEFLGLLADEFGRDRVVLDAKCVGFEEDEAGVNAHFADGRSARGAILVGADGIQTVIRERTLGDGAPRESGIVVWRAMPPFDHPAAPLGVLKQAWGLGKLFAMVPGTRARVFWFACGLVSEFGTKPATDRKQELVDAFAHWIEPIGELLGVTEEAAITRTIVYDRPPARRWGTTRVTLLGDAAHPMVPTLGQGGSQAIEDGVALAKNLSRAGSLTDAAAVGRALHAYEADRIARTTPLIVNAQGLARIILTTNPVKAWLRNLMLRFTPAASWQRRLWVQHYPGF